MEVKFSLELRVNYRDPGKNEAIRITMRQLAQHALATAALLSDGQKPQVAVWGDDFYEGTKDIELFEGKIEDGLAAIGEATGDKPSEEMLDALRNMNL